MSKDFKIKNFRGIVNIEFKSKEFEISISGSDRILYITKRLDICVHSAGRFLNEN